jgi:hypothetical protein
MSLQERVLSLKGKHAALDAELAAELQRPLPDTTHCTEIKREKLRLKEQILSLEEGTLKYEGSDAVH